MILRLALYGLILIASVARAADDAVLIPGEDYAIAGIFTQPQGTPEAAVLLLHGTASQKNEVGGLFRRLADKLAEQQVASLRIDFAGAGDSPVGHDRFTLSGAVRDAGRAVTWLRQQPSVGDRPLVVLGFSQGGLIAQRTALAIPDVAALVTWSAVAADGEGAMQAFVSRYYDEARTEGVASVSFDWLPDPLHFSLQWFEEIRAQRTMTEMRAFSAPILALAGLADDVVPYSQSARLAGQSEHPASRAVLFAGADHIFNVLEPDRPLSADLLLQTTVEFISRELPTLRQ